MALYLSSHRFTPSRLEFDLAELTVGMHDISIMHEPDSGAYVVHTGVSSDSPVYDCAVKTAEHLASSGAIDVERVTDLLRNEGFVRLRVAVASEYGTCEVSCEVNVETCDVHTEIEGAYTFDDRVLDNAFSIDRWFTLALDAVNDTRGGQS